MSLNLKITTLHATGRRHNAAAEDSVFLPREEPPEVTAEQTAARRMSAGKGFCITGAALVWAPILIAIVYTVVLIVQGTDYAVFYGFYLLIYFWTLFLIAGILLHIAARKLNTLRRFTGIIVILSFCVGVVNLILAVTVPSASSMADTTTALAAGIPAAIATLTAYFCIVSMAVTAILLLRRTFFKKSAADSVQ
ncbi:MAG TPA: hypothetical protein P5075_00545 [Eubacteriales bacterium]|nr:hypothetical protein [Eubacteriales bacterium]